MEGTNINTDEIFIDVDKLPQPLPKEETRKLIVEANRGSIDAKNKLIMHNIRLVLYEVTNTFKNINYDQKELVAIGNIGLLKALNKYDLNRGFEFSTYASKCIQNEILMFLRKLKRYQNIDSIEKIILKKENYNADNEVRIKDVLSNNINLVEDYEKLETYKIIREIVTQLPRRDSEIVMLHFGFYEDRIYTQNEIADMFKISQSYVSKLITKILKILKIKLEEIEIIESRVKTSKVLSIQNNRF